MKISEIESSLRVKLISAIYGAAYDMHEDLRERVEDYYSEDWDTRKYRRTGKMRESLKDYEIYGSYPYMKATVGYDTNYSYDTGSWGGYEVIDSAAHSMHGGSIKGGVSIYPEVLGYDFAEEHLRDNVRRYF